jgi:hypothetical protein
VRVLVFDLVFSGIQLAGKAITRPLEEHSSDYIILLAMPQHQFRKNGAVPTATFVPNTLLVKENLVYNT